MDLQKLLSNKSIKSKEKAETISQWLLNESLTLNDLTSFAAQSNDQVKATCIESIEFATKIKPAIINKPCFDFVVSSLTEKAPRVKWESAKIIGNTASLFQGNLKTAIINLINNTEHEGIVVRWSAAFALGEIIKLKTPENKKLIPAIKNMMEQEEKSSIKKIYASAFKTIEER